MRIISVGAVLVSAGLLGGCTQVRKTLFPESQDSRGLHTDPATVCRATPGWYWRNITSDHVDQFTGEIQSDGITAVTFICPDAVHTDIPPDFPTNPNVAGCLQFNGTGMAHGVFVEYGATDVVISLAMSQGFKSYKIRMDETCHG